VKQALRCVILSGRPGKEKEIIELRLMENLTGNIRVHTADFIAEVKRYISNLIRIEVML